MKGLLKCNETKTSSIVFSTNNSRMRQKPVYPLLKWNSHIEELCGKLFTKIFLLRRLSVQLTPDVMRIVHSIPYSFD